MLSSSVTAATTVGEFSLALSLSHFFLSVARMTERQSELIYLDRQQKQQQFTGAGTGDLRFLQQSLSVFVAAVAERAKGFP